MPEALLPVLYVLLGGLLTPLTQGFGYLVTRRHRERDQERQDRRKALAELQDAILDLVNAEQDSMRVDHPPGRAKADQARAVAMRKIRLMAARIGDDQLWELVHTPNPDRMNELHQASPGQPGDEYDTWNKRIRELYATLST